MTAILLAAGVGRRLSAALEGRPKCLLRIGGKALLARLLDSLDKAGVRRAVIVVGYRREMIEAEIGARRGNVEVSYVFNPDYEKGAILSLWAARDHFDDDVLIMDADVLCPDEMVVRLVRSTQPNCFLLDGRAQSSGEEQMLMARRGRVHHISRTVDRGYDTVGESVGFLKVARESASMLRDVLRFCVEGGRDGIEHEEAYPIFLQQQHVGYERVDDLPWAEIDFPEDVEHVQGAVLPLIDNLDRG